MGTFRFKQFNIEQDRCAQQIGTDGVLLGAWANTDSTPYQILDIGTGTGVISLMLAQRFEQAQIEAIELDDDAFEQAVHNFENSDWSDRLYCYHAYFQEFYNEIDATYDLIVCNPPFYDAKSLNQHSNIETNRIQARFDQSLPFNELLLGVSIMLDQSGTFACIIPYDRQEYFITTAAQYQLYPTHITHVKGTIDSKIKRSLINLQFTNKTPLIDTLVIEKSRHNYTDDYIKIVREFYLNM